MAKKKSRRRAPPCGRLKTGCISGLMSIFDFRQGRITRRMISGGRLSSFNQSAAAAVDVENPTLDQVDGRASNAQYDSEEKPEILLPSTDTARASVKELMEEEMLNDPATGVASAVDTSLKKSRSIRNFFGLRSVDDARCFLEEIGVILDDHKPPDKLDTVTEQPSEADQKAAAAAALVAVKLRIDQKMNGLRSDSENQPPSSRPLKMDSDGCIFRRRSKTLESFVCLAEAKSPETDAVSSISSSSTVQDDRTASSRFSFTDIIKRRIWHAVGKEKPMLQYYSSPNKTRSRGNFGWSSPNRNHFYTERFAGPKRDRPMTTTTMTTDNAGPRLGGFNIYIEAKKHLSEMLNDSSDSLTMMTTTAAATTTRQQLPRTLGGILSIPVYARSPCHGSPLTGTTIHSSSPHQSTLSGLLQEDQEDNYYTQDSKDLEEEEEEEGSNLSVSCVSCNIDIDEASDEDSFHESHLKSESLEEDSSPAVSTSQSPVNFETVDDPVAVRGGGKDQAICTRISTEDVVESPFEYVEAVLLGSGLDWDDFQTRWLSSRQILDPNIFEEVETFSGQPRYDQKLLFDCADEALLDACGVHLGYRWWSGTTRKAKADSIPPPGSAELIEDVWKHVKWNLFVQAEGYSQDQLVEMDLVKKKWLDVQHVIELIGFEMEETIFDQLLEDVVVL